MDVDDYVGTFQLLQYPSESKKWLDLITESNNLILKGSNLQCLLHLQAKNTEK